MMAASYNGVPVPKGGTIEYSHGKYQVPDNPIIPFIEGDGTGRDIWKASQRVFDAAVEKAYGGKRQIIDLYSCVRPVRYYQGVPSPVKSPELVDIVIFRENTEDVYSGIEFKEGTPEAEKLISFLNDDMLKGGKKKVRKDSGVGIKPISITGTKRLVRFAIKHAVENKRKSVTLVHKGNIQKFTEGAFREWGYEVAVDEFRDAVVTERESWILGNQEANPKLTVEENAALIEPGLE